MSRVVKYSPCPSCRSKGNDSRGDNLVNYSDGSSHCFACQYHVHSQPNQTWFVNEKVRTENKTLLPYDFTRDVPVSALKWLLQYGLPWSYWKDSIGYSPSEERLVFLVGTPTQFSIGRYVGKGELGKLRRKWYVWGDSHKHCEVVRPSIGDGGTICLVEDLVSAHKIATSVPSVAVPLFGTQVHPAVLYYLRQEQKPVVLWLDKDQQGSIMKKANQLSVLTGCPVRTITTVNDPKALSKEQINAAF